MSYARTHFSRTGTDVRRTRDAQRRYEGAATRHNAFQAGAAICDTCGHGISRGTGTLNGASAHHTVCN